MVGYMVRHRALKSFAACAAGVLAFGLVTAGEAHAAPPTILGQSTNFDVGNGTDKECEGFEVDIEDITDTQVTYTWPGSAGYINPFGPAKSITNTTFPDGHTGVITNAGQETEPVDLVNPGDQSSLMVTETYTYTGPVDPADNSATCNGIVGDPLNCVNFVGPMIARQMESAQLSNPTPNRRVLTTVVKTGTATSNVGGTVTSNDLGAMNPGPIDCGTACFTVVDPNTPVTLTATPSAGYDFKRWTGACLLAGTNPVCHVTMTASKTATATFVIQPKLKVTIIKHGTVTSSPTGITCSSGTCTAQFPRFSTVTLTATPRPGFAFVTWTGACLPAGTNHVCTIAMTATKLVVANFN